MHVGYPGSRGTRLVDRGPFDHLNDLFGKDITVGTTFTVQVRYFRRFRNFHRFGSAGISASRTLGTLAICARRGPSKRNRISRTWRP